MSNIEQHWSSDRRNPEYRAQPLGPLSTLQGVIWTSWKPAERFSIGGLGEATILTVRPWQELGNGINMYT